MRIGVGVMALASSLLVNFFLVFQLLSSASRPQHPTREQVDLPLSLAVLEKRNAQLGDLKRAVELSLMRPVDLRNTLIDALLKVDGQAERLPEFQQLDNLGLADEALAVSRNASYWELVQSVVDLKPVYRRQISTGTEYNLDAMRNGLIVLLHNEAHLDISFLQELTNGKLVAAIPSRLTLDRTQKVMGARVQASATPADVKDLWQGQLEQAVATHAG